MAHKKLEKLVEDTIISKQWLLKLQAINHPLPKLPDYFLNRLPQLTQLMMLDLSNNTLTDLPGELVQLTNLKALFLDNNRLKRIPDVVFKMTTLGGLKLDH